MIKVNGIKIKREHFPDGTQRLLDIDIFRLTHRYIDKEFIFDWKYENDEELITLIYLVNHFRENIYTIKQYSFILNLAYVPNARMDRTKNINEVFTLKHFCKLINDLKFDQVIICDPHSNICTALLNNVFVVNCQPVIAECVDLIEEDEYHHAGHDSSEIIYYYPDAGAAKKYSEIIDGRYIYGEKKRDWETGQIQGLEIKFDHAPNVNLEKCIILMVDDIISYGGSLYYSTQALKKYNPKKIYAYVTHAENSVLDKEKGKFINLLEDGSVEKLYTTDSIFTEEHKKIEVLKL